MYKAWKDSEGDLSNCIFAAVLLINALKVVRSRPDIVNRAYRLVWGSIMVLLAQLGDDCQSSGYVGASRKHEHIPSEHQQIPGTARPSCFPDG